MIQERSYAWKTDPVKKFSSVNDPYLSDEGRKIAKCKTCGLIYQKKRWTWNENLKNISQIPLILCPACQKIKDNYPEGYLILQGKKYLQQHKEEISHIIQNEADRAKGKNPLQRIMQIIKNDECWTITTTDEKLAQHLGREIYKAHSGQIKYQFGQQNKIARVYWKREVE